MVTRTKYNTVRERYLDYNWTAAMIKHSVDLKPWEVDAIIEQLDADRADEQRPQLELFKPIRSEVA